MNIKKLFVLGVVSVGATLAGSLLIGEREAQAHCTAYHPHHCIEDNLPDIDVRPNPQQWFKVRVKICNDTDIPIFYTLPAREESHRVGVDKCWTHTVNRPLGENYTRIRWDKSTNSGFQANTRTIFHRKEYWFKKRGSRIWLSKQ